ncbi:DUF5004 domain-containing protein [Nonlabens dokdonensis]|nr:lipocalin family protein [Nonlabens dokdonensis]
MKKYIGLLALLFIVASCEKDASNTNTTMSTITGNYVLTSLVADTAVDFDQDGVSQTQLLNEATCFSNMDISFMANGDFTATVAEPEFDAMNVLSCPTSVQTGTYTIDASNLLMVTANVNGGTVTENIQLTVTPTTIEFTVSDADLNRYINGRAGTPAGNITSLVAVYTRI